MCHIHNGLASKKKILWIKGVRGEIYTDVADCKILLQMSVDIIKNPVLSLTYKKQNFNNWWDNQV